MKYFNDNGGWFPYSEGPGFSMLQPKVEFTFPDYVKIKRGMVMRAGDTKYLVIRKYRNKVWAVPANDNRL